MIAMLLAGLCLQDLDVTARASRRGDEYELEIRGRGGALLEESLVGLRFHRRVNRVGWSDGAIGTGPHEEPWGRAAHVAKGAFEHRERCAGPGEVEVVVTFDLPGGGTRSVVKVFRTAPGAEVPPAVARDARRLERLRGELRELAALAAEYLDDPCSKPRRGRELARRLAHRRAELREEERRSLFTGTIDLLRLWLGDLHGAVDARAEGKGAEGMLSSLSGQPHTGEQALAELTEIEDVLLREQALLLVREAASLRREVEAAAAQAADPARWARFRPALERTLGLLREAEGAARTGPRGARFAEIAVGLGEALADLDAYLAVAAGKAVCPESVDGELAARGADLSRRLAALEERIRASR